MNKAYLSEFTITSVKWANGIKDDVLPIIWQSGQTEWNIFDHNLGNVELCKEGWNLSIQYDRDVGTGYIHRRFGTNPAIAYTEMGTFEIKVNGRNRDYHEISKQDNDTYRLGHVFSESDDYDEEIYELATKLKKLLKKKFGK